MRPPSFGPPIVRLGADLSLGDAEAILDPVRLVGFGATFFFINKVVKRNKMICTEEFPLYGF